MEFFRAPSLSMTIYRLPAGATDEQQPHNEDEVYYVVEGRAQFLVEDESRPVGPGTVLFVAKHVEHRFHAIEEDLTTLVVFAPAKT
ncbi:MAG: cupin domain-containing protein [Thermoleophilia bacterium]|nr:cupin domain-containing protein [Thermoleophilia bacterium]